MNTQPMLGAQTNISSSLILIIIITLLLTPTVMSACDNLVGCTNCTAGEYQTLNSTSKLFICSTIANCSTVDVNGICTACYNGTTLNNITANSTTICSPYQYGCKLMTDGICTQCWSLFSLSTTNNCNILTSDYCWRFNATQCTQCSDQNIISKNNCSVNVNLCPSFDYQRWVCPSCLNMTLHESGIFCYDGVAMANCLVISSSGCLQCEFGYYLNNSKCMNDISYSLQYELIPTLYYTDKTAIYTRICLDPTFTFNTTSSLCNSYSTTINYCILVNNSLCISCVSSFYLAGSICRPCYSNISNCLTCDIKNCFQCNPTYFLALQSSSYSIDQVLAGINSTVTSCLPCSVYGCIYCRSEFDSRGIFSVRCDKCLFGYKLHNHTCVSCPWGTYFSLSQRVCLNCTISNCMYCTTNQAACDQCNANFYYDNTNKLCNPISLVLTGNKTLNSQNSFEILNKSMPYSSSIIINDQKSLMTNCAGSSNGYACLCSLNTSISYTSLCYTLASNITSIVLTPTQFSLASKSYSTSQLKSKLSTLLLLSQLPSYDWVYLPGATDLISNTQFAYYLQISSNYIRNHPSAISTTIQTISLLVFKQFYKTFDPYQSTVLYGPGYYFKYLPANPLYDDSTVVSLSQNTLPSLVFIYYNSSIDSNLKRLTGTTYVFLNQNVSTQLNIKIKKISFLGNNQYYSIIHNDGQISLSATGDSDGFVTIAGISTSIDNTTHAYYVSSYYGSAIADQFVSSRIENIIYRVAFIYILIFLTLYLTLIPFCAIFDCVDKKSTKRKIKIEEQETYQGIKHRSQSQISDQVVLKINYKDFFPIYNIANTERPRRLLKLCLFLVNSQHSITFLSLIYFHLDSGQPLVAVLLSIPAYLCTVIMGYICGLLTVKIPGKLKYLINLLTLGYWIIWIPVMSSFIAYEYAPYVFTFAIIFFFIDMLIDFLQTLLMYFTIKQQNRQIKLFKVLSRWLSYRGYYEFDRMAKQLDQIRDTA